MPGLTTGLADRTRVRLGLSMTCRPFILMELYIIYFKIAIVDFRTANENSVPKIPYSVLIYNPIRHFV